MIGGTCESVGVAGCWLIGCYGVFSKKFGAGALNLLSARVVLSNGTLVTASKCSHPELFWSLRGGGGGVAGVVTEFTVRTHPAPKSVTGIEASADASTLPEFQLLMQEALKVYSVVHGNNSGDEATDGGFAFRRTEVTDSNGMPGTGHLYTVNIRIQGYDSDLVKHKALLQPLIEYVHTQGGSLRGEIGVLTNWTTSDYDPKLPMHLPWGGPSGNDKSASTVDMMTRFIPLHHIETAKGRELLAAAFINVSKELPVGVGASIMIPKGQAGLPAAQRVVFNDTALNPVILDAAGLLLVLIQLPWFEQLPPSSKLLKALWPGLRAKVKTFTDNKPGPITALCVEGVTGNETAAVRCLLEWQTKLIPSNSKWTRSVTRFVPRCPT